MNHKRLLILTAIAAVSTIQSVQAKNIIESRWYIAPYASFVKTSGDRNASDGWGGGMGFGKILNSHINVEFSGFHQEFNGDNGAWSLTGGTANLQYFFQREVISPYAVIALGGMNTCISATCNAGVIGEVGLGATYLIFYCAVISVIVIRTG